MDDKIGTIKSLTEKLNNCEDHYEFSKIESEISDIQKDCKHEFEKSFDVLKCVKCFKEYGKISKSKYK